MYFLIEIMEQIDSLVWNGLGVSKTRNIFLPLWESYMVLYSSQGSDSNQDKKHRAAERESHTLSQRWPTLAMKLGAYHGNLCDSSYYIKRKFQDSHYFIVSEIICYKSDIKISDF